MATEYSEGQDPKGERERAGAQRGQLFTSHETTTSSATRQSQTKRGWKTGKLDEESHKGKRRADKKRTHGRNQRDQRKKPKKNRKSFAEA